MRLRVRYGRAAELAADHGAQWQHGGMLVRVEAPPGLALYQAVELELVAPDGTSVTAAGQVLQMIPGAGVAVGFDAKALSGIPDMLAAADDPAGAAAVHEIVTEETEPEEPEEPEAAPRASHSKVVADTIQKALHGSKDERWAIIRGMNKHFHAHVLRNPNLEIEEVLAIAKLNTVDPQILATIAARKEWQRPDIALALARNPKTPLAAAVKMLDFVTPEALRQLAKTARPQVQAAARKKVAG